jgi:ubiquinone/menaquinone biosynthesis C-methylase UbiE
MRKLMRVFFYYFYHTLAWTYDSIAALVSIGRWWDWGKTSLPHLRGSNILEIGFGTGHLQVELNRLSYRTFGVDESRQMAALAHDKLAKNGIHPNLSRGYAQFLPFASLAFDSVVACFPSEYILSSQTLSEVYRILKSSGRLVVIPMARIIGGSSPDRLAKWLFRVTGQVEETPSNLLEQIQPALVKAGFKVEIITSHLRQSEVIILLAEKSN